MLKALTEDSSTCSRMVELFCNQEVMGLNVVMSRAFSFLNYLSSVCFKNGPRRVVVQN